MNITQELEYITSNYFHASKIKKDLEFILKENPDLASKKGNSYVVTAHNIYGSGGNSEKIFELNLETGNPLNIFMIKYDIKELFSGTIIDIYLTTEDVVLHGDGEVSLNGCYFILKYSSADIEFPYDLYICYNPFYIA